MKVLEYRKQYYQKNKGYFKKHNKKYREKNKQYFKQYMKEWRKENYIHIKEQRRNWRHRKNISKKFISKYGGKIFTLKEHRQRRKALIKGGGNLPIERIQMVYEDNIKKYGTLTCIYCLKSIEFGKDTLEHKQPLSRGGTNEFNNLAIACQKCNSSKGKKTEEEYRKEI